MSGCEHCGAAGPHTCHRITPDADALAFREGVLRRDRDALAMERDHYRERAQTLRARFDWAQHVAAEAMREGLACAEWQRTCLASERTRRRVAETERDAARAEAAGLRAAVARTTPPTEAEAAAHNAALGWWLISRAGVCPPAAVDAFRGDGDVTAHLPFTVGATWLPLDASGRPCPWPTPALGATGEGR